VAFVLAYFVAAGMPAWPAAGSAHKVFYLGLTGLLVGVVLDSEGAGDRVRRGVALALPLVAVAWVIAPFAAGTLAATDYALIGAVGAAVLTMFLRLTRITGSAVTAPIQLAVAAAGVAAIAWYGGNFFQVEVGLILAAASAGFLLWNWPVYRFPPGAALLLGAGIPVAALSAQMAIYGNASKAALAVLVLVFFSDWIAGGIRLGGGRVALAMRPVLVLVAGALVVGAAALASVLQSGAGAGP
jgi:Fuc2NAc and GlcNAc transferase